MTRLHRARPPSSSGAPTPASAAPSVPGEIDLLAVFSGEQAVAYARSVIVADKGGRANLELGTDDGFKVWLNGRPSGALNVARPLKAGSDIVPLDLAAGRNILLIKITQNNMGWGFSARLKVPAGSPAAGVRPGRYPCAWRRDRPLPFAPHSAIRNPQSATNEKAPGVRG